MAVWIGKLEQRFFWAAHVLIWWQVGIASVWYQGNPCNMHLLSLGEDVKKEVDKDTWTPDVGGIIQTSVLGSLVA